MVRRLCLPRQVIGTYREVSIGLQKDPLRHLTPPSDKDLWQGHTHSSGGESLASFLARGPPMFQVLGWVLHLPYS